MQATKSFIHLCDKREGQNMSTWLQLLPRGCSQVVITVPISSLLLYSNYLKILVVIQLQHTSLVFKWPTACTWHIEKVYAEVVVLLMMLT